MADISKVLVDGVEYNIKDLYAREHGGGSGHTIVNKDGTDMATEGKLQFLNSKVTDDSTNGITKIQHVVPLSQAEYDALPSSKNSDGITYDVYDAPTQAFPSMGYTPVGTIISVMGTSAPTNFLACNGQTVNIADYPVLANYFYEQFGQINKFGGDGTTTFGIPDLRGEFLRGTGTNSHSGQGNGGSVGNHQDATEIPVSLNVNGTDGTWQTNIYNATGWNGISYADDTSRKSLGGVEYGSALGTIDRNNVNNVARATVRPTNTSVLYCIAVRDIYIGKDSALAGRVDAINERFNYSTAEKVVGKWIDGKPLYRRTFTGTTPSDIGAFGTIGTLGQNIDYAEIVRGHIDVDQFKIQLNDSNASGFLNRAFLNTVDGTTVAQIVIGNVSRAEKPATITVEYTKTTDTAS